MGTLRDGHESEDSPDVNDDVDGVGQQLQGEFRLQEGVNLLHMIRDVLTDVLGKRREAGLDAGTTGDGDRGQTAKGDGQQKQKWRSRHVTPPVLNVSQFHVGQNGKKP